jgi:hypothetical protein
LRVCETAASSLSSRIRASQETIASCILHPNNVNLTILDVPDRFDKLAVLTSQFMKISEHFENELQEIDNAQNNLTNEPQPSTSTSNIVSDKLIIIMILLKAYCFYIKIFEIITKKIDHTQNDCIFKKVQMRMLRTFSHAKKNLFQHM